MPENDDLHVDSFNDAGVDSGDGKDTLQQWY
jgi:hypothetical protein